MKILLVCPVSTALTDPFAYPPLGPLSIGAVLEKAGCAVEILFSVWDAESGAVRFGKTPDLSTYVDRMLDEWDIVGVNVFAEATFESAKAVLDYIPENRQNINGDQIDVIAGGAFVTSAPEETIEAGFDIGVMDEGEITILEVLAFLREWNAVFQEMTVAAVIEPTTLWDDLSLIPGVCFRSVTGEVIVTPHRDYIGDLDELPPPAWHLIDRGIVARQTHVHLAPDRISTIFFATRGCPWNCIGGNDLVALPDKLVRPNTLTYDQVEACDNDGHTHVRSSADDRFIWQGDKPVTTLELSNGLSITATPDHKIMGVDGESLQWQNVGAFRVGDWVVVRKGQNQVTEPVAVDGRMIGETEAFVIGWIIGDGKWESWSRKLVVERPTGQAWERFGAYQQYFPDQFNYFKVPFAFVSNPILSLLADSGIDLTRHPFDTSHSLKVVPPVLFRSPVEVVRAFIDGVLSASRLLKPEKPKQQQISTSCRRFAEDVACLSMWIGDSVRIRTVTGRMRANGSRYTSFRVEWSFPSPDATIHRPNLSDQIPFPFRLYRNEAGQVKRRSEVRNGHVVHRHLLRELLQDDDHPLIDARNAFVRVRSVHSDGIQPVYDVQNGVSGLDQPASDGTIGVNGVHTHNCTFCDRLIFGRLFRTHSAKYIVDHLLWMQKEYGVNNVRFPDDMFTTSKKWVAEFCDTIKPTGITFSLLSRTDTLDVEMARNLADAGCKGLFFGIESGSDRMLKAMNKRNNALTNGRAIEICRDAGMVASAYFIFGFPGETEESVDETISWLERYKPDRAHFSQMLPIHGTALWNESEKFGIRIKPGYRTWSYYDSLDFPVEYLSPPHPPEAEMYRLRKKFSDAFVRLGYASFADKASVVEKA